MSGPAPAPTGGPHPPDVRDPARATVRRLELTILRRLDGLLHGDHAGLLPDHGTETGEARPYVPGDDVRRIDWTVTARTQEPHVRDTIADHELELTLVVDTSASLAWGTATSEKRDVAWAVAGAFALLASRGGNRVGALLAGPEVVHVPPRGGRAHVLGLLTRLHATTADGDTDLTGALVQARRAARRRGMVVVASDFLVRPGWSAPLRALTARHDVVAVEVVDPRELTLPPVGYLTLVDPETGRRRHVDTRDASLRERFAAAADAQRRALAQTIAAAGADHLVVRTDRDWLVDLVRFVQRRRRRRLAAPGRRP